MVSKLRINGIKERFNDSAQITYQELYDFYKLNEPDLKENTFKWRIWKLKQYGIISDIKKGVYVLRENGQFIPMISRQMKKLGNLVKKEFPYTNNSIWNTEWLNEFMIHQPVSFITIIEVEGDAVSSVFTSVQDISPNVFIYPLAKGVMHILNNSNSSVVVKPLVSRAPIMEYQGIMIPKIEKILVDLYSDNELFVTYQGEELINIFNNIAGKYVINLTTLFGYASRRNKKEELKKFITEKTEIELNTHNSEDQR